MARTFSLRWGIHFGPGNAGGCLKKDIEGKACQRTVQTGKYETYSRKGVQFEFVRGSGKGWGWKVRLESGCAIFVGLRSS